MIPSSVEMLGTIRALTHARFTDLRQRVCSGPLPLLMCAAATAIRWGAAASVWSVIVQGWTGNVNVVPWRFFYILCVTAIELSCLYSVMVSLL